MDAMFPHCAGLDIHKDSVVACVRHAGHNPMEQVRTFGTTTEQLLALGDWLTAEGVTHAAMESTGVYWKPVWNLLEGRVQLLLANAQHMRNVPGRKTDVADCQWIAQLMQHGLLKASFVPPAPQRQLRDLTRQRSQLVADRARVANRVQKVLEDANIKLASVASDVLGKSGRDMLDALIAGQSDPAVLADLARLRLRAKIPQLRAALNGKIGDHHRFMLKQLLRQVDDLEKQMRAYDRQIAKVMSPLEKKAIERLDEVPGIDVHAAQVILAEIGTDMSRFASDAHLASWAGLCPGNHQSAGKRHSGKTNNGNRWLRAMLCQCAWAAGRTKGTYYSAQYRRLAARRGRKRAILAVAHSQLVAIYHLLEGQSYKELGANWFDKLAPERLKNNLVSRLQRMGYDVTLQEKPAA